MNIYLIGGAVRDLLLGQMPKDKDYVVIGASKQQILQAGFKQIDDYFTVFVHPRNRHQYSLARREFKTGPGYKGFMIQTQNISLQEDLKRRDFTVNAIALDEKTGKFFYAPNAQKDLKNKILRHCDKSTFSQDPLRLLRLARFLAQLPNFQVHPLTMRLAKTMVGALRQLSQQRILLELQKVAQTPKPSRYFVTLGQLDALKELHPYCPNTKSPHFNQFLQQLDALPQLPLNTQEMLSALLCVLFSHTIPLGYTQTYPKSVLRLIWFCGHFYFTQRPLNHQNPSILLEALQHPLFPENLKVFCALMWIQGVEKNIFFNFKQYYKWWQDLRQIFKRVSAKDFIGSLNCNLSKEDQIKSIKGHLHDQRLIRIKTYLNLKA